MSYTPIHFIGEAIEVVFNTSPLFEKKPGCPDAFAWRGTRYQVIELVSEWHDYQRRGRFARNLQDKHAATASVKGSWGVGRDYYRVQTDRGKIFDLYYDRAPKGSDQRKGAWFLDKELVEDQVTDQTDP